ncbi:FUSC family protein [Comamonas phosphati]|nr:FUSC family protein [Comamonas phosphati]
MSNSTWWRERVRLIQAELRQLTIVNKTDRLWQMPVAAALSSGLPLLLGAFFGRLDYGLVSSIGGLTYLYLPSTPLQHRMVWVMACAFGMTACYTLGMISHFLLAALTMPALTVMAILVTMICRLYRVGPPGSIFFIMSAAIGAYSRVDMLQVPTMVGLFAMGCVLSCIIAFCYSLLALRLRAPKPVEPLPTPTFDYVVFDAIVIGLFVGLSLALAQLLQLERPYWVPVSCLAVIQGASLRAVWNRQAQRILGTCVGLLLSWGLLLWLPPTPWNTALTMMVLTFVIEMTVVRHYGFAAVFITPMTILLAEAATLGHGSVGLLIQARFADTVLGCSIGLLGGMCLHSPRFRRVVGAWLRGAIPARLRA